MASFEGGSWITFVKYDEETKRMSVQTAKDNFELQNVPRGIYDEFEKAPSKGAYFNRHLKGKYLHKLFE